MIALSALVTSLNACASLRYGVAASFCFIFGVFESFSYWLMVFVISSIRLFISYVFKPSYILGFGVRVVLMNLLPVLNPTEPIRGVGVKLPVSFKVIVSCTLERTTVTPDDSLLLIYDLRLVPKILVVAFLLVLD